jgi:GxxExxY protein
MTELIHEKLSYEVVGVLFDVYNSLGSGYQEKYYQRALASEFNRKGIEIKEQLPIKLYFREQYLGIYYVDFLIDDKIVLEIKSSSKFYARDIKQVLGYLNAKNLDLGILACFSKNGLIYKRILKGK